MTAFSIARPAYMAAHMPAGPAPTITTSCSNTFPMSGIYLARRAPNVAAAVDDDDLAGDVLRLDQIHHRRDDVGWRSDAAHRRVLVERRDLLLRHGVRHQHRARRDPVDAHV